MARVMRHEGEVVDRITEGPHRDEGDEERHRQRDHRDEGVGGAPEENEDHEDDEDEGDREGALDVVERIDDRLRAIEDRDEVDRARQFALQLGEKRANRARDRDGVRARLPRNGEDNDRGGRMKSAREKMARESARFRRRR